MGVAAVRVIRGGADGHGETSARPGRGGTATEDGGKDSGSGVRLGETSSLLMETAGSIASSRIRSATVQINK